MVHLFDLVLKSLDFVHHGVPFLLKQGSQLLIEVGQSLCLVRIFLDLTVFPERLLSHFLQVFVCLFLEPLHVSNLLIKRFSVLISFLLLALHLDNLVLQLLIFKHQQLVLGIKLRDAVQSAVNFDTERLSSLFDALVFVV